MKITVGILICSDKGFRGEREDKSQDAIAESLGALDAEIVTHDIVPDEEEAIVNALIQMADETGVDLILTSGGTGLSPRDVTPEATRRVVARPVPGLSEAVRMETRKQTPLAILSRAEAGIRNRTLIVNLPGSPKAVRECMDVLLPVLPHAVETLRGEAVECARTGGPTE